MKRPSFQFYPKDLLSDMEAMSMPNEALGIYFKLLCYDWVNDGIPADGKTLMRMAGFDWVDPQGTPRSQEDFDTILSHVYSKFMAHPSKKGFLTNSRLQKERKKQDDFVEKKVKAGKEGAKKRWSKPQNDTMAKNSTPIVLPMAKNSSSSASSSSFIKENIIKESPTNHILYQRLVDLCASLGLKNEVAQATFLLTIEEFREKINTTQELRDCLYWCKENKKQKITVMRIRNWFKNALSYAKANQLRLMTKDKDKVQTQESLKSSKLYG